MKTNGQFHRNAPVMAANGQEVGSLERVVFSPESGMVSHIVVRTGGPLNKVEKVVPIDVVAGADEERITLRAEAGDPEYFHPFEEERVVDKKGDLDLPATSGSTSPELIGYPEPDIPYVPDPGEQYVTQTGRNIPEGTVALEEGAKVMSSDGKHVGDVERVLVAPDMSHVTHLLISGGTLSMEKKRIPLDWVETMTDNEVFLRVEERSVAELDDISAAG